MIVVVADVDVHVDDVDVHVHVADVVADRVQAVRKTEEPRNAAVQRLHDARHVWFSLIKA